VVLDPSTLAPTVRIVVRPVHDTTPLVPFELPPNGNLVASTEGLQARRQIDVVAHQDGMSGLQSHDEALVPRPFEIIRQHPENLACELDHHARALLAKEMLDIALRPSLPTLIQRYPDIKQDEDS